MITHRKFFENRSIFERAACFWKETVVLGTQCTNLLLTDICLGPTLSNTYIFFEFPCPLWLLRYSCQVQQLKYSVTLFYHFCQSFANRICQSRHSRKYKHCLSLRQGCVILTRNNHKAGTITQPCKRLIKWQPFILWKDDSFPTDIT